MNICMISKKVTAYSGYKANERPLFFTIDDQRLEVRDIICRWVEPDKDFFKVIADDDKVYTLSWNRKSDLWLIEKISSADKMKEKTKGCAHRTIVILITAWLVMMAVPASCNSGSSQPTQAPSSAKELPSETPSLNGATLLDTRCSVCHSADKPRQSKKTPEQWEQTVTRMIGKGARLTEAEKTVLVDYLAKTYGP